MKELKLHFKSGINKLDIILKKGFSHEPMAGNYKSVFKGKGLEFEGYRAYDANDDAMMIDWKATLRIGEPVVRMLREERNVSVFFMLDVSNSMLFSSHDRLKCEIGAEIVAMLCLSILEVGDSVGVALFNSKVSKIIPPSIGRAQYYKVTRMLEEPENYGGEYDLGHALQELLNFTPLQKNAVVFVVSDFIGLKQNQWEGAFEMAATKFDLNALIIRDPIDRKMPEEGIYLNIEDPYSNHQLAIHTEKVRKEYASMSQTKLEKIERKMRLSKAIYKEIYTDQDYTYELIKFFKMREHK